MILYSDSVTISNINNFQHVNNIFFTVLEIFINSKFKHRDMYCVNNNIKCLAHPKGHAITCRCP